MKDIYKKQVALLIDILTESEKEFLLSFVSGNPIWKNFDYSKYPAIKWKLLNINKLKQENLIKFKENIKKLDDLWKR